MSFLFASSHLPAVRSTRPELEEEEEENLNPESLPRSGGVRASSHLPERREAEAPYRALSQRGAQAVGRQLQRTEETEDEASPHQDGVAAAKASGVFEAVRQQFNRDDSPHFMDEDGNPRPRDEARLQDSPFPRNTRDPQGGAGAPPRTVSHASSDTRPWYLPRITQEDLRSQGFDDDAASPHSPPTGRPEVHDPVYRAQGASLTKPEFNDLAYRFNGSPEEAKDHRRDDIQNVAAPADARGHPAQQTKTYGTAPDNRTYASNLGSDNQPGTTAPGSHTWTIQELRDQRKKALDKWNSEMGQGGKTETNAESEAEAGPTVEMLEQKEKALEAQAEGARQALHNQLEIIKKRSELRLAVEAAKKGYDKGKEGLPKGVEVPFDYGMDKLGISPDKVIEKIDADIAKRRNELLKYWEEVERANMALQQAKAETEAARRKAREQLPSERIG